jgi:hypothetical protein
MSFKKSIFVFVTTIFSNLFLFNSSYANFHEVELHSTEALLTFSEQNSINLEGNYLLYMNKDWQLLFGGKYEKYGDALTRSGISLGGVYNFGATNHNEKYYVKPQITFNNFKQQGFSDNVTYVSGVIGKRIPIFKGANHTINYTPSIGLSIPLSNTDNYDMVVSVSVIGLSIVFN